jgi:ribose 5-phosphate isomerase A
VNPTTSVDSEKRLAAVAAADLAENGMTIGLGTGSTVAHLIPALARRRLKARYLASSPGTERFARQCGLLIESFNVIATCDLCIDSADQISPDGWLIKGKGGALTREKVLAASAQRFVVIADSTKQVPRLHPPVPLELMRFGLAATLQRLSSAVLRDADLSPDGGVIADWVASFSSPFDLATLLKNMPGVVEHGLFPSEMVSTVVLGRGSSVEIISHHNEFPEAARFDRTQFGDDP